MGFFFFFFFFFFALVKPVSLKKKRTYIFILNQIHDLHT